MLLIFGLSIFFRTIGNGIFHCPRCGGDREYRRRAGRRWFTLFFLPVIPLNRVGEIVQCRTCKTRFDVAVLRLPTVQQMSRALPTAMRAAAVTVLHAGNLHSGAARGRAVEAVRAYGGESYTLDDLDRDLTRTASPERDVAPAATQLAVEAKEWFLAQTVRIALADGPLSDNDRQALHRVAAALGMTPAHALGVIATTEGAARG